MPRLLLTGAAGFVGRPLASFLELQGYDVVRLARGIPGQGSGGAIFWDPDGGVLRKEDFEGFDAVVHLAGEPLSLGRWNGPKRSQILYSRTAGTYLLSTVLSEILQPPKIFLSASAVGFYGDRGEEVLTEESGPGRGFLASVCCEWEKACRPVRDRGARTVQARFGMVLGPNGGALKKMVPAYRLGLGGRLGTGKQWISWAALDDLVRALGFLLSSDRIEGPVNIVSPNPVRQEDFSHTLASLLRRPELFSLPAWLLKLRFGLVAEELLLSSARVEPKKLLSAGFSFQFPQLREALLKAL